MFHQHRTAHGVHRTGYVFATHLRVGQLHLRHVVHSNVSSLVSAGHLVVSFRFVSSVFYCCEMSACGQGGQRQQQPIAAINHINDDSNSSDTINTIAAGTATTPTTTITITTTAGAAADNNNNNINSNDEQQHVRLMHQPSRQDVPC